MSDFVKINDLGVAMAEYIKAKIKKDLPNTDLSSNSPLMDTLIYPWATLGAQLTTFGTSVELRTNLTNASNLSDEEVDAIGDGNYFMKRGEGSSALGTVTFSFESISDIQQTIIPEGLSVGTKEGLNFIVTNTTILTPAEMYTKWDGVDMVYKVSVACEAEKSGAAYNVTPGKITVINSAFTVYSVTVINNAAFKEGLDMETKESYLARIRAFYSSRTLETKSGYKQQILENFQEVKSVGVAGYGDELMTRDLADSMTMNGVTLTDFHIGGKVDLYIKGSDLTTETLSIVSKNKRFACVQPASKIDQANIIVTNLRTSGVVNGFDINFSNVGLSLVLSILSSDHQNGDSFKVEYNYDANGDLTYESSASETYLVDENLEVRPIKSPFVSAISFVNKTRGDVYSIGDGSILESTYRLIIQDPVMLETSREVAVFKPLVNAINGDIIEFTYSYDETVKSISEFYGKEENRIVTRDVLIRKATEVYFFIEMRVKLLPGIVQSTSIENAIFNAISIFMSKQEMNTKIDESDIINEIYQNEDTATFIDYISVGLDTFYANTDPNAPFDPGINDGPSISLGPVEFPSLHTLYIGYI